MPAFWLKPTGRRWVPPSFHEISSERGNSPGAGGIGLSIHRCGICAIEQSWRIGMRGVSLVWSDIGVELGHDPPLGHAARREEQAVGTGILPVCCP